MALDKAMRCLDIFIQIIVCSERYLRYRYLRYRCTMYACKLHKEMYKYIVNIDHMILYIQIDLDNQDSRGYHSNLNSSTHFMNSVNTPQRGRQVNIIFLLHN